MEAWPERSEGGGGEAARDADVVADAGSGSESEVDEYEDFTDVLTDLREDLTDLQNAIADFLVSVHDHPMDAIAALEEICERSADVNELSMIALDYAEDDCESYGESDESEESDDSDDSDDSDVAGDAARRS